IGFYTHFLAKQIQDGLNHTLKQEYKFKTLVEVLEYLLKLEDKHVIFDLNLVFALGRLKYGKKDIEKALILFEKIFYKRHSFCVLKLLL
ncbi:hypothetical protein QL993_29875, partial [Bacillus wiedmannii]